MDRVGGPAPYIAKLLPRCHYATPSKWGHLKGEARIRRFAGSQINTILDDANLRAGQETCELHGGTASAQWRHHRRRWHRRGRPDYECTGYDYIIEVAKQADKQNLGMSPDPTSVTKLTWDRPVLLNAL